MTEKQGGSDVRANTTRAPRHGGGRRGVRAHRPQVVLQRADVRPVPRPGPDRRGPSVLRAAARPARRHAQRRFQIQRLKDKLGNRSNASSEVEFAARSRAWSASRAAACRRSSRWSTTRAWTASSGRRRGMRAAVAQATWHAAHRSAFGARLADQPLMVNVLADLAIESEAATVLAMRLARAYDDGAGGPRRGALQAPGHRGRQVPRLQARPGHASEALECLGGNGYVEASGMPRLYREAPLGLDLGGLRQRHGARRPARPGARPRPRSTRSSPRSTRPRAPTPGSTPTSPACARSSPTRPIEHARPARRRAHGAGAAGLAARPPRAARRRRRVLRRAPRQRRARPTARSPPGPAPDRRGDRGSSTCRSSRRRLPRARRSRSHRRSCARRRRPSRRQRSQPSRPRASCRA